MAQNFEIRMEINVHKTGHLFPKRDMEFRQHFNGANRTSITASYNDI